MSEKTVQRQSQLITTFGHGAMVDLPKRSVLIGGLDRWRRMDSAEQIDEPALARLLEGWLRAHDRLDEGETVRLLAPPVTEAKQQRSTAWGRRDNLPNLVRLSAHGALQDCGRGPTRPQADPLARPRSKRGRRRFYPDDGMSDDVTPIRFVGACPNGHLQDIDWRQLLHHGETCHEPMWLVDQCTSGLIADLVIYCGCGVPSLNLRDLTQAEGDGSHRASLLGRCKGRKPWISARAREDCRDEHGRPGVLRLLTRSATNAYFSQTISVISLPSEEDE